MKTVTTLMIALFVFALVAGTIYWFVTYEPAGTLLLLSLSLMPLIVAGYAVRYGALRDRRAQDDPSAAPHDAAGEDLGTFPAASVWPIFFVLGVITAVAGLIYGLILLPVGLTLLTWAVVGLMRESRG